MSDWFYYLIRRSAKTLASILEHVPYFGFRVHINREFPKGPAVFVVNHKCKAFGRLFGRDFSKFVDMYFLGLPTRNKEEEIDEENKEKKGVKIHFIANDSTYAKAFSRFFLKNMEVVPKTQPRKCLEYLAKGEPIIIFFEGPAHEWQPGIYHTGAARLAISRNVKLIPVAITTNTNETRNIFSRKITDVYIDVGKPVEYDTEKYKGYDKNSREQYLEEITQKYANEIWKKARTIR